MVKLACWAWVNGRLLAGWLGLGSWGEVERAAQRQYAATRETAVAGLLVAAQQLPPTPNNFPGPPNGAKSAPGGPPRFPGDGWARWATPPHLRPFPGWLLAGWAT